MDQMTIFCVDMNEYYSQLCYFRPDDKEPISYGLYAGTENYLIPMVVAKEPEVSRWYVGTEAVGRLYEITGFLEKAFRKESILVDGEEIPAFSLLVLYIRRVLGLVSSVGCQKDRDGFVFCLERASKAARETLRAVCEELEIPGDHVFITDKKEALSYYIMNQEPGLRMYDVLITDYWHKQVHGFTLHTDRSVSPQVVSVTETVIQSMEKEDEAFYQVLDELLGQKSFSAVFLVGSGFEGEWMKRSLNRLCTGRRVFFGMNLYAKGACYYVREKRRMETETPVFVYLGGGNVLSNVCLKAWHQGKETDVTLIQAGLHWQDAKGSADILLKGPKENLSLNLCLYPLKKGQPQEIPLSLPGFVVAKDTVARLSVTAKALSRKKFAVMVKDCGFGELYKSQGRSYEFTFDFIGEEK